MGPSTAGQSAQPTAEPKRRGLPGLGFARAETGPSNSALRRSLSHKLERLTQIGMRRAAECAEGRPSAPAAASSEPEDDAADGGAVLRQRSRLGKAPDRQNAVDDGPDLALCIVHDDLVSQRCST